MSACTSSMGANGMLCSKECIFRDMAQQWRFEACWSLHASCTPALPDPVNLLQDHPFPSRQNWEDAHERESGNQTSYFRWYLSKLSW